MGNAVPADDIDRMARGRILELQASALEGVLRTIEDRSPFYRGRLEGRSRTVADDPSRLSALPLTTREDLASAQSHEPSWGGLLAVSPQECSLMGFTNAIATGLGGREGLALAMTDGDMRGRVKGAARALAAGGSSGGDRTALVTEVARSVLHQTFLGAFVSLGSTPFQTGRGLTLRHVRHTLPVLAPTQLLTHPTYARTLARLLSVEGRRLPVERLFLWGEVGPSVPSVRRALEGMWHGAAVRDVYAAEELGVLAGSCPEGSMHAFEDLFVYEVVDPATGKPTAPGATGELVVTTLRAEAMPLVRYCTGDLVSMGTGGCPCGRTHATLRVHGRVARGPWGVTPVDLAALEDIVETCSDLIDAYRVLVDDVVPEVEVSLAQGADAGRAATALEDALRAHGHSYGHKVVEALPRFHHRATRVIIRQDVELWQALAEEQRRLEE